MEKEIVGRECKHVFHLPQIDDYRDDTYVIKEVMHYKDGTTEQALRTISNFKRPYWVTKEPYRTHKDKKEAEDLDRVNKYTCTESNLYTDIAKRLGPRYVGNRDTRFIKDNPYVYGIDVSGKTYIKHQYLSKYPDAISENKVATFDIETDTINDEIIIISLSMNDKIYTVINKSLLLKKVATETDVVKLQKKFDEKLRYLYNKYVPKTPIASNIEKTYVVVENQMECITKVLEVAHLWKPDFIAIWNIGYDIPKMLEVCEKYNVLPKDIFSDPSLPDNLKYFKYMEGPKQKTTESGKFKPINMEEQWHWVNCPASFWWIDAASTHRYVRVGGKTVPGGYGLDNILKQELGAKLGKLKFDDEKTNSLKGLEWHLYMVAEKPLEYIIYNQWDNISMLELDAKTKDLSHIISMLSMGSGYDVFSSGPKRIIDALHFFYLDKGRVLACKPSKYEDNVGLLGLGDWIKNNMIYES